MIAHFLLLNLVYRRLIQVIAHYPLLNLVCGWHIKFNEVEPTQMVESPEACELYFEKLLMKLVT